MTSPAEPLASASAGSVSSDHVIREAIDLQRFPWIRPLVAEYSRNYASLGALFAGDPSDPVAWQQTIERVTRAYTNRAPLHAALIAQLTRRGAPREAHAAATELAAPGAVAVVTGQQAGVFGGPFYTVLKAVTAIQLARQVRATHHVPVVPVFWVEADDHDWAEVRSTRVLDKDGAVITLTAADPPGAGAQPVGRLVFDDSMAQLIQQLRQVLAPTEFTADVLAAIERRYRPGVAAGTAFAGWLDDLLGRFGLVVLEANDPVLKPLAGEIFAREISDRPTSRLARETAGILSGLGHAPQVEPADDGIALFYLDESGRRPLKLRGDTILAGDTARPVADVRAEALAHPERFSPNVLLRPIVQDRLLPNICYVAGPAELAYQAQLGRVYRAFGVEPPLLHSRASVTLLDAGASRFLDRYELPLESLQTQDDSALNRLLEQQLPADVERAFAEADRLVGDRVGALRQAVVPVDPTLAGAVDTTVDRMRDTLKTLHGKVIQAAKRKDETLRRQFIRSRSLVFPDGHPQERALGVVFFVNRYGMGLVDRLVETIPTNTDKHYVLAL